MKTGGVEGNSVLKECWGPTFLQHGVSTQQLGGEERNAGSRELMMTRTLVRVSDNAG